MNYRSDRTAGRTSERTLRIPLTKGSISPSLKRVELRVEVAGRRFNAEFAPDTNLSTLFVWDGYDSYGKLVSGGQHVSLSIEYVYDAVYQDPQNFARAFARLSGVPIGGSSTREEVTVSQHLTAAFQSRFNLPVAGWGIGINHFYDFANKQILYGNGQRRGGELELVPTVETVAGLGLASFDHIQDFDPNIDPNLNRALYTPINPESMAVGPDGLLYIAHSYYVRTANVYSAQILRIGSDGSITSIAGRGFDFDGDLGDGGQAINALLGVPTGLTFGPDGGLYFADSQHARVRRIGTDGIITTVAGNGMWGYSGDGGPATEASIFESSGYSHRKLIAVGQDDSCPFRRNPSCSAW